MRTLALFAAAAALAVVAPAPARADHRGKIDWKTPEDGFAAARSSRKPILLFFSASW